MVKPSLLNRIVDLCPMITIPPPISMVSGVQQTDTIGLR